MIDDCLMIEARDIDLLETVRSPSYVIMVPVGRAQRYQYVKCFHQDFLLPLWVNNSPMELNSENTDTSDSISSLSITGSSKDETKTSLKSILSRREQWRKGVKNLDHYLSRIEGMNKLTEKENFQIWKSKMRLFLRGEGLLEIVEDKEAFPSPVDPEMVTLKEANLIKAWKRADDLIAFIFSCTVSQHVFTMYLMNETSGKKIWEALMKAYGQVAFSDHRNLYRELMSPIKQDRNVLQHLEHLQALQQKCKLMNFAIDDKIFCTVLLSQLPKEYDPCAAILRVQFERELNFALVCSKVGEFYYHLKKISEK